MTTQMTDESYSDYFKGDDTYGVPAELKAAVEPLYKNDNVTMREILKASMVGVELGEQLKDKRRYIANCLEGLYLDYGLRSADDELYQLRYGRLLSDIEKELRLLRKPEEEVGKTGKTVDQHWTTLKWLVEDQQKIIS